MSCIVVAAAVVRSNTDIAIANTMTLLCLSNEDCSILEIERSIVESVRLFLIHSQLGL